MTFFSKLEQRQFTGVIDLTWGGWAKIQNLSEYVVIIAFVIIISVIIGII